MKLTRAFWATFFMLLLALAFAVGLALVEGGVWTAGPAWFLGASLASAFLSFLIGTASV
jgi:hypothetical protein